MDRREALGIFESLSSGVRLDVYRLLVKQGPEGMVAGQIASALGLPPANLSFHLKDMVQSGLLGVEQEGRFQRYRADLSRVVELIGYLSAECCGGHPEQCDGLAGAGGVVRRRPSARSGPVAVGEVAPIGTRRMRR